MDADGGGTVGTDELRKVIRSMPLHYRYNTVTLPLRKVICSMQESSVTLPLHCRYITEGDPLDARVERYITVTLPLHYGR